MSSVGTERHSVTPRLSGRILQGLEHGLARLTVPAAKDEPHVTAVIGESAIVKTIDSALATAHRLAASSAAGSAVRQFREEWAATPAGQRRQARGIMLLVAALAYIAIAAPSAPPGWMWLLIPMVVLAAATLLIGAGSAEDTPRG